MTAARQHANEPRRNPRQAEENSMQQRHSTAPSPTHDGIFGPCPVLPVPAHRRQSVLASFSTALQPPCAFPNGLTWLFLRCTRPGPCPAVAVPSSPTPTLNPAQAFDGSRAARCCVGPFPVGGVHVQLNSTTPRTVSCQSNLVKVTFHQRPPSVVTRTPPRAPGHIANASLLAMPLSTAAVSAPQ